MVKELLIKPSNLRNKINFNKFEKTYFGNVFMNLPSLGISHALI